MDLKQLKYFQAIVEAGNISLAAKRLFMTQPSLSQQLKLLENDLNAKLLERGSRKITLTEAGRLLYHRSEKVFDLLRTTSVEVKEIHDGCKGTLRIGAIASASATILPAVISDFHKMYPQINFQLREDDTPRILELLDNDIIEIGIVRSAFDTERYHYVHLNPDPLIVAMSQTSSLETTAQPICITELENKPLLLHRSNEAMIVSCCQNFGFIPHVLCTGDDVRTLLSLAEKSIGLAIVPESALALGPNKHLKYNNISNSTMEIKRSVIWTQQKQLSSIAQHFLTILFQHKTK